MRGSKTGLFLCMGHRCVGLLEVEAVRVNRAGIVEVKPRASSILSLPADVDPSDSRGFGLWLSAHLEQCGVRSKSVTLVLERSDVVSKRLHVEGIERAEVELPGMVRYQLMRQVAFQTEGAPIDFLVLHPTVQSLKQLRGAADVLAATAPPARVEHLKLVCEQAGLEVRGISIYSLGLTVFAEQAMSDRVGPTMVIAPTLDGVDFSIYQGGRIVSSRWIETHHLPDGQDLAELVISEARRTRMSHQMAAEAEPIHSAIIIADEAGWLGNAEDLAVRVGDALGVISELVLPGPESGVSFEPALESDRLIGLAGLAVRASRQPSGKAAQLHQIDLANPIAPADASATTRQLVLAAILLLIVSLGGVKSYASMKLRGLDNEIEALRDSQARVVETYHAAVREHASAELVKRWSESSGSPLEHLAKVVGSLPSNEQILLRSFTWSVRSAIDYPRQRGSAEYDARNWKESSAVSVAIELLAKSREIADSTRKIFVDEPVYTVQTAGPDGTRSNNETYPERLELRLDSVQRRISTDPQSEGGV